MTIQLKAKDEAGQEALSEKITFTLPQRPFTNPLAKALVEQRRNLVLAPDDRKRVQVALDALLIVQKSADFGELILLNLVSQWFLLRVQSVELLLCVVEDPIHLGDLTVGRVHLLPHIRQIPALEFRHALR